MASNRTCPFDIGDRVIIGGHKDLMATITGIAFYEKGIRIEIWYINNGEIKVEWVPESLVSY